MKIVKAMNFLLSPQLLPDLINMRFGLLLLLNVLLDLVLVPLHWRLVIFALVPCRNVLFHLTRVEDLFAAILTLGCLMHVIAEGLFAEFLAANPADEISWVALEVVAVVSVAFLSIDEN